MAAPSLVRSKTMPSLATQNFPFQYQNTVLFSGAPTLAPPPANRPTTMPLSPSPTQLATPQGVQVVTSQLAKANDLQDEIESLCGTPTAEHKSPESTHPSPSLQARTRTRRASHNNHPYAPVATAVNNPRAMGYAHISPRANMLPSPSPHIVRHVQPRQALQNPAAPVHFVNPAIKLQRHVSEPMLGPACAIPTMPLPIFPNNLSRTAGYASSNPDFATLTTNTCDNTHVGGFSPSLTLTPSNTNDSMESEGSGFDDMLALTNFAENDLALLSAIEGLDFVGGLQMGSMVQQNFTSMTSIPEGLAKIIEDEDWETAFNALSG